LVGRGGEKEFFVDGGYGDRDVARETAGVSSGGGGECWINEAGGAFEGAFAVVMGWNCECTGDEKAMNGSDGGEGENHFLFWLYLLSLRVAVDVRMRMSFAISRHATSYMDPLPCGYSRMIQAHSSHP
jgi:hypothetical protein